MVTRSGHTKSPFLVTNVFFLDFDSNWSNGVGGFRFFIPVSKCKLLCKIFMGYITFITKDIFCISPCSSERKLTIKKYFRRKVSKKPK